MIAAVEAQKQGRAWTKDHGAYIPNPATWINQGRWEDEVTMIGGRPDPGAVEPTRTSEGDPVLKHGFPPVQFLQRSPAPLDGAQLDRIRAGEKLRDVLSPDQLAMVNREYRRIGELHTYFPETFV